MAAKSVRKKKSRPKAAKKKVRGPTRPASSGRPTTIDEYLLLLDAKKRSALSKLRKAIRSAAPEAEECISYGLAAFRLKGMLVGFGAAMNHCAFYLMSGSTIPAFSKELAGYDTSRGTIRFAPEKPLPVALVRKLVKARIVENGG